ncbi:TatD family hydrolase [Aspergillus saccharolyticus JOP 1030-1]|uniref:Metallo-dependent hydrolase n=1 Tax=Aspergillus saccharolyticus JOP 1030-1 TaxID=1450539 RepID=A0A319A879_9EURO|nr:Metallo-dependent hydrolase [Aspergillus saccharolyticus JOP 1030-1]PYH43302.1 Metallo-dependent hydrolase [Aspergillus saccharolyticus JOP 1030-1]
MHHAAVTWSAPILLRHCNNILMISDFTNLNTNYLPPSQSTSTLEMFNSKHNDEFPWHLGVYDAHCHPTDTMSSLQTIPQMKATTLTVMATRGEDQDLVLETAQSFSKKENAFSGTGPGSVLPCFGWHPWFSHQIIDDITDSAQSADLSPDDRKTQHYKKTLTPAPGEDFIASLPDLKPLSQLIEETRSRLRACPNALVGEVGLDRAFRLPNAWTQDEQQKRDENMTPGSREGRTLSPHRVQLNHQKAILEAQLRLAGELGRPVSVHSVQAHGAVFDLFKKLWSGYEKKQVSRREKRRQQNESDTAVDSDAEVNPQQPDQAKAHENPLPFPPRICMHSYSGPVEPLKQFLHPSNPSVVYFSFSAVINFSNPSSQKVMDVIKSLPDDRILIESDLHTAGPQMDELLEQISRQICKLRGWTLEAGVQQFADNWKHFVYG